MLQFILSKYNEDSVLVTLSNNGTELMLHSRWHESLPSPLLPGRWAFVGFTISDKNKAVNKGKKIYGQVK